MKENRYFRVIRTAKPGTNWPNGVDGRFIDIDDDGRYRFVPSTIGDWWDQDLSVITAHFYDLKEDEQYTSIIKKLPVVAWGLLPQYIRWEAEKDLKDIYSEYYGRCFEAWKSNVRYDIELMQKSANEIEAAFVRAMIEDESYRVEESSKRLFPYLPEDERRILKQVGDGYIAYLHEKLQILAPSAMKKQDLQQAQTIQQLPNELNTEKSIKYFTRAENNGYLKWTGNNATWEKTHAMLGYFCLKAFDQPRPITCLELLFGVKNLAASITQASYSPKRTDVKNWRGEMDKLIFFD